ncbi:hypothetical protein DCMF_15795 [Candidatus Formimonas warabiya]|uniref:Anti-sigma-W factor RsiW n=2 Tax=Formimonas warabiya TaxID=1761012 RepID=A0A3G1KUB7_FORW1|nr:hypothetical protein DCMF_15795 [Candidatus Formimonas warabiya]
MCLDENVLQAYLDGEVSGKEHNLIKDHLASCSHCQEVLKRLEENAAFVDIHLITYQKQLEKMEYPSMMVSSRSAQQPKKGVFDMVQKYRKLAGAVAAAACLGILFSFAPVRTWAAQFLTLFRVQNVATTTISVEDMEKISQAFDDQGINLDIKNLGKVENQKKGKHRSVDLEEAKELLGYTPLTPSYLPDNMAWSQELSYEPENIIAFTFDINNLNTVVEQLGGTHLFPENLDGQTFTLFLPDSVTVSAKSGEEGKNQAIHLLQAKSPEMDVPKDVDVEEVRNAVLDLPVIPDDVKQKLAALKNWQNTLYVPQPAHGSTKPIKINGIDGVAITDQGKKDEILIWQDQGYFYSLGGENVPETELLKVAESLH